MRQAIWLMALACLAACAPYAASQLPQAAGAAKAPLADLGPAPELSNSVWLNTDHPLRLAELRGRVVLLDMWTFD